MIRALTTAAVISVIAGATQAEPTRVMVRAQAADAKFIGDNMGGVKVTLTDAATNRVLARGLIKGGTGDTTRIMMTPRVRGAPITDGGTAGFEAVLDIMEPTLVRVDAEGPVGKPGASIRVSSTQWVLPGRNVGGDGWILTFPGLVIEPQTAAGAGTGLKVEAKVSLMCGCPIEPGGLWDANGYSVEATLRRGPKTIASTPLTYAGTASQFAGQFSALPRGRYTLRVIASDAKSANAGVSEMPVRIP